MYRISIPKISQEELLARYERIKPVVKFNEKRYFLLDFSEEELAGSSYLWMIKEKLGKEFDITKYCPMPEYDFECIHKYSIPDFFKPSIAEVLAQISDSVLDEVCAFEIIEKPQTTADLYKNPVAFENGFHTSIVRLYKKN